MFYIALVLEYPPLKSVAISYKFWFGSHYTYHTNCFSHDHFEDLCKNAVFGDGFWGMCQVLGGLFCFVE